MNLPAMLSMLHAAFAWAWQTSQAATILIALALLVPRFMGKAWPPRCSNALWVLVVVLLC